ncbi:uncharacterized protein [Littorina saxatilis]|uniref:uncharacterized protein n=1 Tax=Littorina saxatilis TaxID=31220 RepID=UPI0038B6480F
MASPNKKTRYDFEKDINEIIQNIQDGGLSDAEQCGAVEAASKHCAESIFLSLISPHCTSSQLHYALPHLASRGLWQAVGHILQRSVFQQVQGTTRRLAIEKACQVAGENELVVYILPACSTVETACVLAQVVARGLWRAVGEMLQRGFSDTLYIWTLQESFKQAKSELVRNHILPHCTRDYLNRLMSYLISKGRWNDVDKMLQCVEEKMSTWSVHERQVDSKLISLIVDRNWSDITALYHKAIEDSYSQAETLITGEYEEKKFAYQICFRTEDGLWKPVAMDNPSFAWSPGREGFPSCCSHLQSVLAVICFEPTFSCDQHVCVHFQCAGYQLDSVFTDCVRKFSSETDTDHLKTRRVNQIVVYLKSLPGEFMKEVIAEILRHVFILNVSWALCKVSEQGPNKTVPEITTGTAGVNKNQTVDGKQIRTVRENKLNRKLSQVVAKQRWQDVGATSTECVSDSQQEWLIHIACMNADEEALVRYVLPHCSDRLLDSVLTLMVVRRGWMAVVRVIQRPVSDSKKRWAVLEACKHSKEDVFDRYDETGLNDLKNFITEGILPHCADDMLDSVLTILVERHLWWSAVGLLDLKRNISDCMKRWVVQNASVDIDNFYFEEDYSEEDGSFINIVAHCADDQMDDVLEDLVEGWQWRNVGEALNREVSDSVKRWAVEEACTHYYEHNDDDDVGDDDDNHDDDGDILGACVPVRNDEHTCRTCIEEGLLSLEDITSEFNDFVDEYIIDDILPHCANDQLDTVLTILVRRRLWMAVGELMKRGVSDSKELWVVQEVCRACAKCNSDKDYEYVLDSILPHCTHHQLNCLLTTLVPRHDWRAVGRVLKQDVPETMRQWVVQEVCKYCTLVDVDEDFEELLTDYILPECSDEQLSSLLRTLRERRLWRAVAHALMRNVSDSAKHFAVQEACTNYVCNTCSVCGKGKSCDDFILEDVLPHCGDAHLQSVLTILAERNLFKSVRYVLKREVSETELCRKLQTVFMRSNESLIQTVLAFYVYDDIRSELETLASRRLWKVFLMLLHRFAIDTLHSWAIMEDCSEPKKRVFWDMVSNPCDGVKELSPAQWRSVTWSGLRYSLKNCLHWDTLLCEVLCEALLGTVKEIWLSGREKEVESRSHTAVEEARSVTEDIHQHLSTTLMRCKSSTCSTLLPCIHHLCQKYAGKSQSLATREPLAGEAVQRHGSPADNRSYCTRYRSRNPKGVREGEDPNGENGDSSSPLFQLHFLKYLTCEYYKRKAWTQMTDAVLVVLTTTPVVPGVQSVALRIMVREKRWDVIRHACLSCVCEQDRRQVFQAAVKQRQWGAVKRWADYSLYDDQRLWALGEAKGEKRWDVYLKLADHGLSEWERMGVLYRVAMHADWKLVRHMLNTVADVSHMKDLLTNARPRRMSQTKPAICHQRIEQLTEFKDTLKKDTYTLKTLKTAAKQGKWQVVLYNIRHKPDLQHARRALKAAVSSKAWQTVIQLVRLETEPI